MGRDWIMSGIFGILSLNQRPVSHSDLEKMRCAMAHRGVDGSGLYLDEDVGLGHLKTCFTPQSEHENLPYFCNTSQLVRGGPRFSDSVLRWIATH
jgi:glutamine phosphoribosylpyrophosphate amidotransferase